MVALVVEIEGTVDGRGESTGSHNTTQHSLQLRMIIRWDIVEWFHSQEKTFANCLKI